jgi:hypothetical protein
VTSKLTDFSKTKQRDSSKNFINGDSSKTEGMRSLIDGLPVTIFRTSDDSSWTIRYMSENILELTGHSSKA